MPLDLQRYAQLRPMLYHITASSNLDCIRLQRMLNSAANLDPDCSSSWRRCDKVIRCDDYNVTLRRQAVVMKNVILAGGWSENDYRVALNSRVFFWPGNQIRPLLKGRKMLSGHPHQIMLRIGFQEICQKNEGNAPQFCRSNSGAPRQNPVGGRRPRGPDIFLGAEEWSDTRSDVVEVSFAGSVHIPDSAEVWDGAWQPLRNPR
jgi:hypothetical protein